MRSNQADTLGSILRRLEPPRSLHTPTKAKGVVVQFEYNNRYKYPSASTGKGLLTDETSVQGQAEWKKKD
jgi:hypothetical protein